MATKDWSKVEQGEWIGLVVHPVKDFTMDVMLLPGFPMDRREYGPDDEFVVEHDFRYAGDTIHVGCPNEDWAEFTSDAFSDKFGTDALNLLDRITSLMSKHKAPRGGVVE